ncbi:MAG: helix-turn-helix domain-containing protein [Armatimonadota bacterium]
MDKIFPAVVLANHFQFGSATRISYPSVQSRMLLWCKEGNGEAVINQATYRLLPDDYLVLPWNHSITYRPDKHSPFLVGGVHFIPNHSCDAPIWYDVAHSAGHPNWGLRERRDACLFGCDEVLHGSFAGDRSLEHLAEYIICWFLRGEKNDAEARWLGSLLVNELHYAAERSCIDKAIPDCLNTLLLYMRNNLNCKYSVQDMAEMVYRSAPTVTRLFRRYLNSSPIEWLIQTRLERAANQLVTTDLPIGEIGKRVGIDDSYYFSKRFKQAYGLTPTSYRKKISMLPRKRSSDSINWMDV